VSAAAQNREENMAYVDGFVIPVPTKNKELYRKLAEDMAVAFRDHGALSVVETWGDDVPPGKVTSFPMAVKVEDGETVVFSWITWPDRATRDKGNAAVMEDQRAKAMMLGQENPFDGKRMIFGGFQTIVEA
jgi:uncharacterized protein YbaA (DUF1428 family)